MPNADLTRREKPCPTCNGVGGRYVAWSVHDEEWVKCPVCRGTKVIPAETPEEYAARLRALVEQARKERDWLADQLSKIDSDEGCPPGKSPAKGCNQDHLQCWLDAAARAVAGKDGA